MHRQTTDNCDDPPSAPADTWQGALGAAVAPSIDRQIEVFEQQMEQLRRGELEVRVFAESRLRRGIYGQRYDNGQRHDGVRSRDLALPEPSLLKGPETLWHAPGMQRIKLPFGELTARQLEVLGELAEEYADGICHITTRQDVQFHFVHIEDTPDLMRRLAAVGITTLEACGNAVRNITGCPLAGVCHDEPFDITPYAKALSAFLLGHPDAQDFGRKFKISFSGCAERPCALAHIHDLGLIAAQRSMDGIEERGFAVWVGGGLGAVPHSAKLLTEFLPESELLPVAQAICRVFARHGEKRNRARARLKFLVAKMGIDDFRQAVEEERQHLPEDGRWLADLPSELGAIDWLPGNVEAAPEGGEGPFVEAFESWRRRRESPFRPPSPRLATERDGAVVGWQEFLASNVTEQRQRGYYIVTLRLPLGDLTARQCRGLAAIARHFNGGWLRASVEQNLLLRWIPGDDVLPLYRRLVELGLGRAGAGTLLDITSCPGTDTCKLGISASRGLASELERRLAEGHWLRGDAVQGLRIKVSGCFNSCGQHHVADIGFYGVSRKKGGYAVPHFQVVLGGRWQGNGSAFGLAVGAVPSKRIPQVVERLTDLYANQRRGEESFEALIGRLGKIHVKGLLNDLMALPEHAEEPRLFSDWGDAREYTLGDMGIGECAGEVVASLDFALAASERGLFEAQVALEAGQPRRGGERALRAMVDAARALVRSESVEVADDRRHVVAEFRRRFVDSGRFRDRFAGGKFANYLLRAAEETQPTDVPEAARQRIEEAQLFIEAAHAFSLRQGKP